MKTAYLLLATLLLVGCGDDDISDASVTMLEDAAVDSEVTDASEEASTPDANIDAIEDASVDVTEDSDVAPTTMPVVVAFGWQGLRSLSIDEGQTWCETGLMSDPHDDLFRGGTFANGLFVGAHAGRENRGAIIASTNGYDWTALHKTNTDDSLPDNPSGQWYGGVAFGNGTWVAAGGCGQLANSVDGNTWQQVERFVPNCLHIRSLAFGGGSFVTGLDDESWWTSSDGVTWSKQADDQGKDVVWNGSDFIDERKWHGRGLCMYGEGWESNAKIMRSINADCTDAVEVATPSHSVTTIAYGTAPRTDFADDADMPMSLRTCLGL